MFKSALILVAAMSLATPAVAQFPGANLKKAAEQKAKNEAKQAEKDAKEAAKKADKEAKEAAKKAEKDAKEAAKKAEKDAKEAAKEAVKADIVDTLVLPRGTQDKPITFTKLTAALAAAGIDTALKGPGPFTLFAPTDAAFSKIPDDKLTALMADKEKLKAVLGHHVVHGKVNAKDVKPGKVKTHAGDEVEVAKKGGKLTFGGAAITSTDHDCTNGVIHVIDTVVLPAS